MAYHWITEKEWLAVRQRRGVKATGYPCHTHAEDFKGKKAVTHYYWPWGEQPSEEIMRRIGAGNPTRAAEKFLQHYKRNTEGAYRIYHWPEAA